MLGLEERERDWVVVGALPEDLVRLGYRRVGNDFPVFLHPETSEEYALARTERKTAPGYTGFEISASPDVTLEQDLGRRDLTINAMAMDAQGAIIDPYGGKADLEARCLRHVSDAFCEDPLRILRVARFASRFANLGFTVARETMELMRRIVASGEARALVAERTWQETVRALGEPNPEVFFEVLRECGALAEVFPEIEGLFGVPQPERWHPEIDTGVHTLMVVQAATRLSGDTDVRFAALVHDLGKATTPREEWPRHPGHEARGARLVKALCKRLGTPNRFRELAEHVAHHHLLCHKALELRPATVAKLLERLDAYRRPERFEKFLLACQADAQGRLGLEMLPYPQADYLRKAQAAAAAVGSEPLRKQGLTGKALGEAINDARIAAVAAVREDHIAQTNT
jgi:tRNA nucleotidyltransferase (CCA-adding enzyme)